MKKIITRIAMTAVLLSLMVMASPASAATTGTITLTQKDLNNAWVPIGTPVSVAYSPDANGKFSASGVPTNYTLVYYPDPGPTGTFTGEVYPVIGTNMNLPMASDSVGIGSGGAKLWAIPNADLSTTINTDGSQTINWGDASNFLFETSFVNYTATPTTQTQKNITTWVPILNGINANVAISTVNGTFHADGIPDGYTLAYYPNVGTYSNYTGEVYPVVGTNMNLPMANDLNGSSTTSTYCTDGFNPNASPCTGAKLWLVPNTDISATINADGSQTLIGDWNTIAPNILFETNLINYTATLPASSTRANGTMGGTVTGGASVGVLAVTSVTPVNNSATADGTFTNGWKYIFNITVPTNEPNLTMKFANWAIDGGGSAIAVANNMRISSSQADNGDATVLSTVAGAYSTPALHLTGDLNSALDGMQVQVLVETAIPLNSVNGSYTTSYGVNTN
jgi:hypothetical protein